MSSQSRDFDLSSLRNLKAEILERLNHHRNQLDASLDDYQLNLIEDFDGVPTVSHVEYRIVKGKYEEFDRDIKNFRRYVNLWYEKAIAAVVEIKFMTKELDRVALNKNYEKKGLKKYVKSFNKKIAKYEQYVRRLTNIKGSLELLFKTNGQGQNRLDSFIEGMQVYNESSDAGRWAVVTRDLNSESESSASSNQSSELSSQSEQTGPTRTEAAETEFPTPPLSSDDTEQVVPPIIVIEDSRDEAAPSTSRRRKTPSPISPQIEESCRLKRARSARKSILLLPNGFNSPVYRAGEDSVQIINTCGFDSILQILLASMVDDPFYESIMILAKNDVSQFLVKLQEQTDLSLAVQIRDSFLVYKGDSNLKEIEPRVFELNLFGSLSRIWDHYYDSIHVGQYYFNCPCDPIRTVPKHYFSIVDRGIHETDPELRQIRMNNYIGDKLNELMQTDKAKCPNCRSKNFRLELNDQLYIEIISLNSNCTLKMFQNSLHFLGQKFRLAGVVDHKPAHFIAYVRRIDGSWQIYDDIRDTVVELVDIDFKINPEAVVYIKE